jgi:hypothetical protein
MGNRLSSRLHEQRSRPTGKGALLDFRELSGMYLRLRDVCNPDYHRGHRPSRKKGYRGFEMNPRSSQKALARDLSSAVV